MNHGVKKIVSKEFRVFRLSFFVLFLFCVNSLANGKKTYEVIPKKVFIGLPSNFIKMPENLFRIKYPNLDFTQTTAFSDSAGTMSIAFCLMAEPASQDNIEEIRGKMQRQYTKLGVFELCKIKEIDGRKIVSLEFSSKAIDTDIFNLIFATDFEEQLLFAAFNCTVAKMEQGVDIGNQIMQSLQIKK